MRSSRPPARSSSPSSSSLALYVWVVLAMVSAALALWLGLSALEWVIGSDLRPFDLDGRA